MIVPKLKKYLIILNKFFYILQPNNSYTCEKSHNNKILVLVSKLISDSTANLNEVELDNLSKYGKAYDRIFKNSFIYSFFPQLKFGLTKK